MGRMALNFVNVACPNDVQNQLLTFFKHIAWHCAFNIPSCRSILLLADTHINVINAIKATNKAISLKLYSCSLYHKMFTASKSYHIAAHCNK